MEKRYYCFPDIHGCSDVLNKALSFVYKNNPDGGKIIFLGDYIDRGPDNLGVLKTVMNPPENWEFITLMGNHEQMFVESYLLRGRFHDSSAAINIAGFSNEESVTYDLVHSNIDVAIIDWMYNLSLFHIEDRNVFAHAFYDDTMKPEDQSKRDVLWKRMDDHISFQNLKQGLFLTHGHTPRKKGPIKSPNRVNLDCGVVFYGRYVIAEYYKDVQGPVKFHEFYFDKHLDW